MSELSPLHPIPVARPADDLTPSGSAPLAAPEFPAITLAEELNRRGIHTGFEAGQRFTVLQTLGLGATGVVLAVQDHSLQREIAAKLLVSPASVPDIQAFVREARITAALSHPGVLPVHDLGVTARGDVFFQMKRIDGISLADAIEQSTIAQRSPAIVDINTVITITLQVAQALAYAHRRGVLHQDVKPANIMLGSFGEVTLVDWGSAIRLDEPLDLNLLAGTPLYMAPEQAIRKGVDARSDIFALGATLFHTLLLRPPQWSEDPDRFWEAKRLGQLQLPNESERQRVPPALLAILLKALEANPERRYQRAEHMVRDLQQFQAGQRVDAYLEPLWWILLRWYRRNRGIIAISTLLIVIIALLASTLLLEYRKELGGWQPIYSADFSRLTRETLAQDWQMRIAPDQHTFENVPLSSMTKLWYFKQGELYVHPSFEIEDLSFTHPIAGDIKVAWDATAQADWGNMNVVLVGADRASGITCHIGGYAQIDSCRLTSGLDYRTLQECHGVGPFIRGKMFHFEITMEEGRFQLSVDGKPALIYQIDADRMPSERTFAFEGCFEHDWSIKSVQILRRRLPEHMSPLALGDDAMRRHDFASAQRTYLALSEEFAGSALGLTADYKYAIASVFAGDDSSIGHLEQLERQYPGHALYYRGLEARLLVARRHDDQIEIAALLDKLAHEPSQDVYHSSLYDLISDEEKRIQDLDVHNIGGPHLDPGAVDAIRASLLKVRSYAEKIGQTTIGQRVEDVASGLLLSHGEARSMLDLPLSADWHRRALLAMGRYQELKKDPGSDPNLLVDIAMADRNFDLALKLAKGDGHLRDIILLTSGRPGRSWQAPVATEVQILKDHHDLPALLARYPKEWQTMDLLIDVGRYQEVLSLVNSDFGRGYRILSRYAEYDEKQFQALLARLDAGDPDYSDFSLMRLHCFIPVLVDAWHGHHDDAIRKLTAIAEDPRIFGRLRIRFLAKALLGSITEQEFRQQPDREQIDGDTAYMHALQFELNHDAKQAVHAYAQWKTMPRQDSYAENEWVDERLHALDPISYPEDPFKVVHP